MLKLTKSLEVLRCTG